MIDARALGSPLLRLAAVTTVPVAGAGAAWASTSASSVGAHPALHALSLFAIAWLIASMRIGRDNGRWRIGFELSPLRGLVERAPADCVVADRKEAA
jgi:hypothetical protein